MIAAFLPFLLLPTAPVVVAQESLPAEELVRLLYLDDRDPQAKFEQVLALLEAGRSIRWPSTGSRSCATCPRHRSRSPGAPPARPAQPRDRCARAHRARPLAAAPGRGIESGRHALDLGEDLFPDWLRRFYMVGPVGALTDPVPLSSPLPAENDPEQVLKTSYTTGWGETVAWEPRERSRRRNSVPGFNQPYHSGGCVYLLAGVDLAEGDGWLELETSDAVRVLWNSQVVYERLSTGLSNSGDWLRIPLHFRAG
ncbi:MAG: hypothetical protein R3F17_11895 [Planctomycetota bacterium]